MKGFRLCSLAVLDSVNQAGAKECDVLGCLQIGRRPERVFVQKTNREYIGAIRQFARNNRCGPGVQAGEVAGDVDKEDL